MYCKQQQYYSALWLRSKEQSSLTEAFAKLRRHPFRYARARCSPCRLKVNGKVIGGLDGES